MYEFAVKPIARGYVSVTVVPSLNGRRLPLRVYAFSREEAVELFTSLYAALCVPPE